MPQIKSLIARKKEGEELDPFDLKYVVEGYLSGEIPDYQMAAFLMAVSFKGMTLAETIALTEAMIASGKTFEFSNLGKPTVDKHSTGGVGDKTTIIVAPLVASFGIAVPKLSGRGLGHTGGTLDKLESIKGFKSELTPKEFNKQLQETGVVVALPTKELVPADKKIYMLRDATETVRSLPLIVSSVMAKKLALKTDAIVLDIKVGEGGFFKNEEEAREFAKMATQVGSEMGRVVHCLLSRMDNPLGKKIGNALEVEEAIETLQGRGAADLNEVVVAIATEMVAAGLGKEREEVHELVQEKLASGRAYWNFERWITAQGGSRKALQELPKSRAQVKVLSTQAGFVQGIHARVLGAVATALGAGRVKMGSEIDYGAGIALRLTVGDQVAVGEELATLHYNPDKVPEEVLRGLVREVEGAYTVESTKREVRTSVIGIVE